MRWKVDALIETRLVGPADEAKVRKHVQTALWQLIEQLEKELGNSMATSVHIVGCEPIDEDAPT